MKRDRMRQSFERLAIPPTDVRVLKLLPLIYVAWADGTMEQIKKERIHHLAITQYDLSPAGLAVLSRWMREPPTREYVSEGLHDIYLLAWSEDDTEVDLGELPAMVSYAEAVARSTAKALDQPQAVSNDADYALGEVARVLHVDHGESWAKVLAELR